ncbi:MAG TPA: hemolysin family protein [Myxococcaceae bacterium]|jgi:putative hemolysin
MALELLIIVGLTIANGLFSGAEIALLSVRKTRLRELVERNVAGARAVQSLREHTERFLATVQIGITVIGVTAAAFGGATIAARMEPALRRAGLEPPAAGEISFAIVVALVSFLSIVLGELVPKSLALRASERYALLIGRPMQALAWLARPLVWFLTAASNLVLRLFGDRTSFTESRLSPEELQQLVEEASQSGSVHPRTGDIASRAFDLAKLNVADVMVPRVQVVLLPRNASMDDIRQILLEQGHTRMPVYEDTPDHVVGYVTARDLLAVVLQSDLVVLEDTIRPAYFVPRTTRALDVLQGMQQRRILLAVVVDEQGALAGIVTMEDLFEELVGEIFSEHEAPPELLIRQPDGSALVQGALAVRDVNRALGTGLPEDAGSNSIGGLATVLVGTIPEVGTKLTTSDGSVLEIVEASPRRVKLLRVRPARKD